MLLFSFLDLLFIWELSPWEFPNIFSHINYSPIIVVVFFLTIPIFLFKGGSPLPDDKIQECFKKAVRRGKEVRDLTHTACVNIDR